MASTIRITGNTVPRVLVHLDRQGYVTRQRTGNSSIYRTNTEHPVANSAARNPSYIWNIVDGVTYPFLGWQP